MELKKLEHDFTVCKIEDISKVNFSEDFVFLSKTDDEISLVCKTSALPDNVIAAETGWRALRISGTLDFSLVGILAKITGILAEAEISVFAISTYDTDYIFLRADKLGIAIQILGQAGNKVM